jgi:hypothetical protein
MLSLMLWSRRKWKKGKSRGFSNPKKIVSKLLSSILMATLSQCLEKKNQPDDYYSF